MAEHKITSEVVLPDNVKSMLTRQKKATRVNNEYYFRMHPELRTMVAALSTETNRVSLVSACIAATCAFVP